eukprot:1185510-Prorocentrum_minimum.AAC.1
MSLVPEAPGALAAAFEVTKSGHTRQLGLPSWGRDRWLIVSTIYEPKEVLVSSPASSTTDLLTSGATKQHSTPNMYSLRTDPECK